MAESTPDEIVTEVALRVPLARAWRAISDHREFGSWFGVKLESGFEAGKKVRGAITYPGYEHLTMELDVERVEEERVLAFRWHPYAVEVGKDYSAEPTTLVTFELEAIDATTTRLRVTESGFARIPLARRAEAYRMNAGGWEQQMKNVASHAGGAE